MTKRMSRLMASPGVEKVIESKQFPIKLQADTPKVDLDFSKETLHNLDHFASICTVLAILIAGY